MKRLLDSMQGDKAKKPFAQAAHHVPHRAKVVKRAHVAPPKKAAVKAARRATPHRIVYEYLPNKKDGLINPAAGPPIRAAY